MATSNCRRRARVLKRSSWTRSSTATKIVRDDTDQAKRTRMINVAEKIDTD